MGAAANIAWQLLVVPTSEKLHQEKAFKTACWVIVFDNCSAITSNHLIILLMNVFGWYCVWRWALPEPMAQAGFYYQPTTAGDDRAMCFTCNVCLVCWEPTDEPWSVIIYINLLLIDLFSDILILSCYYNLIAWHKL